jgi:2-polyprenyl-6-methoxyphenol hydroxylase-like FAD-dependent oxidoreductase
VILEGATMNRRVEAPEHAYDVIVVGARCAGSPTAMLLAGKGYKVLVVDRATFPSDTVSTHLLHPPGVAALRRWGLLDRLVATGCPPIDTYLFDFGPFTLSGSPGTDDTPVAYGPRRTVLDRLLVDAAAEAGAEVREGFTVTDVVVEDGRVTGVRGHGADGRATTEQARVVIGADGRHSRVARAVRPEQYHDKPPLLCGYYSYWSGLPMDGRFQTWIRPDRAFAAWPTHDELTLVIGGWPYAELEANKHDLEGNFLKMLELAPAFADRVRAATRQARFVGTAVANWFRTPYGPGWALVGDAGYNKDFITAPPWPPTRPPATPRSLAMYEFTCQLATLQPPPPDLQRLLEAAHGNQAAMDGFARL